MREKIVPRTLQEKGATSEDGMQGKEIATTSDNPKGKNYIVGPTQNQSKNNNKKEFNPILKKE